MTLEEAIKYKEHYLSNNAPFMSAEAEAAERLSLEAMKAIKLTREDPRLGRIALLTGEAKE